MINFTKEELWDIYIALNNLKEDPKNKKCKLIKGQEIDKIKTKVFNYIKE
jgi:hypothetical protein